MMLAIAATIFATVSCGGNTTGEGAENATEQADPNALPEPAKLSLKGVSGGEWDNFKPELGEATLTVTAVNGENYDVTADVPFQSPNPLEIKGMTACKVEFYYSNENKDNVKVTPLPFDPAESDSIAAFVKAGQKDVVKTFKFKGTMPKAEFEALTKSDHVGHCVLDMTFAK